MPRNLLFEALINSDRTLAQRIEGAVRSEKKKADPVYVMDKLIYDAFVVFVTKSNRGNSIKFLYDVARFKYFCTQAEGSIKLVTLDRCF